MYGYASNICKCLFARTFGCLPTIDRLTGITHCASENCTSLGDAAKLHIYAKVLLHVTYVHIKICLHSPRIQSGLLFREASASQLPINSLKSKTATGVRNGHSICGPALSSSARLASREAKPILFEQFKRDTIAYL